MKEESEDVREEKREEKGAVVVHPHDAGAADGTVVRTLGLEGLAVLAEASRRLGRLARLRVLRSCSVGHRVSWLSQRTGPMAPVDDD